MDKHTPGDWFYDPRIGSIGCPAGWLMAVEHTKKGDGEFGDEHADGYLGAAAPDLLRALEAQEEANKAADAFIAIAGTDRPFTEWLELKMAAEVAKGKADLLRRTALAKAKPPKER